MTAQKSTPRILVSEDDSTSRFLLTAMLRRWGYDPIATENGIQALSAYKQLDTPSLVLLDWDMPEMNGLDVCKHIRQISTEQPPYIILVTKMFENDDIVQGLNAGANDYITKPYNAHVLQARIAAGLRIVELQGSLCNKVDLLRTEVDERVIEDYELALALAQLEAANKELENFAHIVSHDLKIPLRGMATVANWLKMDYEDKLDDAGREQLDLLVERAKCLSTMIDGILHYSRMGSMEDSREQIDLNFLVKQIYQLLDPPNHIQLSLSDDLPAIIADPFRISQLFQNLFCNAVRYIDKPAGYIEVGLRISDEIVFTVRDNGPGINEREQSRIFKLFQTGAAKAEDSTGVGLAVVKRICEYYDGRVWIESILGEGACFCFTLPRTLMPDENSDMSGSA